MNRSQECFTTTFHNEPKIIETYIVVAYRHPVPKKRPDFHDIMLLLLQHDTSVLKIPKEALGSHPQAGKLGAVLEAGKNMYPDLQNKYENVP